MSLPEIKTPEGTVEIESTVGLVGRLVAYRMLDFEGDEVVRLISAHEGAPGQKAESREGPLRIMLSGSPDLATGDEAYWTVREGIASERAVLRRSMAGLVAFLDRQGPAPAGERILSEATVDQTASESLSLLSAFPLGTAVTAATDLVGMLRTDYAVKGGDTTIGQQPLIAAIAKKILIEGWEPLIEGFDLLSEGEEILTSFADLVELGRDLRTELALVRALFPPGAEASGSSDISPELSDLLAGSDAALKRLEEFVEAVTAAPAAGGPSPLIVAARGGRLHALGDAAIDYVVCAGVEGGGQEVITKRSFNPFGNRRVIHLGGAVGSHYIYDVKRRRTVATGTKPLLGKLVFNLNTGDIEGELQRISI